MVFSLHVMFSSFLFFVFTLFTSSDGVFVFTSFFQYFPAHSFSSVGHLACGGGHGNFFLLVLTFISFLLVFRSVYFVFVFSVIAFVRFSFS